MFVLDTNVVSELRKAQAGAANPGVVAWADSVPAAELFVSVVTLHELELGVLLLERRDPPQGELLRTWLDERVTPAFERRFLPVTQSVARQATAMHVPNPAPFRDALIAATAIDAGMAIVTRNVVDFERVDGLSVVDPWT